MATFTTLARYHPTLKDEEESSDDNHENNETVYRNVMNAIINDDKWKLERVLNGFDNYDRLIIFESVSPQILMRLSKVKSCMRDYNIWYDHEVPQQLLDHIATELKGTENVP